MGFPCGSAGKEAACNAGDLGSFPGLGRSPGKGRGYPLQYSGLENSVDCMELSRPEYWSGSPFPSPGDLPNPGNEPRSPALQADYLPAEPQGKPKNTGMGSLSLLQRISPTQESNCGLLHCRRIPYQLSYAAAAATKSIQSCPTLCDPIDGSHQAPSSLGFSRQEHWSGLPFPSPMHYAI